MEQKITTSDGTPNTSDTTLADAENLGLTVGANKNYVARWRLIYTAAATTTGGEFGINGPAAPTAMVASFELMTQDGTVTPVCGVVTAYNTTVDGFDTIAGNNFVNIEVAFRNGANAGTLIPRFRSEVNTSAITIKAGSLGQIWEVV